MKKFLTTVMSLLLLGLTCMLVYVVLNQGGLHLDWNHTLPSSALPKPVSIASAPPRSQGTAPQRVPPNSSEGGGLPVLQTTAPASGSYSILRQHGGLDSLTDSGSRTLYQQLRTAAYTVTGKADEDGFYPTEPNTVKNQKLNEKQIRMAVLALRSDNPQLFWIANRYSYSYRGGSTVVRLYSYIPADACNAMIEKLNTAVSTIVNRIPPGLNELDREIYIFQRIAEKTSYDDAAVSDSKLWLAHTAAGALVDGKAVCEGYSRAMQLLACYAGLDCRLVNGEGNGQAHMWNVIQIDGEWYHIDPTWIDGDIVNYDYFNVTDSSIRADHKISVDISTLSNEQVKSKDAEPADYNLNVPSCTAVKANYFRAKGIHIRGFDSENNSEVISAIAEAAKNRSPNIVFFIEDSLNYQQTIKKMVKTSPYQLSNDIQKANQMNAGSVTIDENSIRYAEAEKSRGLTVIPSYHTKIN
jgi:hypothetical protein